MSYSPINRPTRREALRTFANGFGMLGLAGVLNSPGAQAVPLAGHIFPRAKRIIFLFMSGGPSHVDLFDPKPRLRAEQGKPLPFAKPALERTKTGNLLGSPWEFARHGQSGMEISELLPNLATCADDLCVIRSMVADNINHNGACLQMNTGEQTFSRPSLGSWLLYGLSNENQNLPGFVVLSPAQPAQGAPLWGSSFLSAAYQGTLVADLDKPIANLANGRLDHHIQRSQLDALKALNQGYGATREEDSRLNARIESFELAYRMQTEAPEAFGIEGESEATKKRYGLDDSTTEIFGKQCLMARHLAERDVRCIQVYHTQTEKRASCQLWDQHGGLREELANNCAATDKPIAGLLKDLKSRGMLDDTLVLWGGIRAHPDRRRRQRPGASSLWIHHVDGRGRCQRGPDVWCHRRLWLARRRQAGACP